MPVMCGSTTHNTAQAATAASAALPPSRRMSIAARLASGCDVAAMASREITGERPGSWKSRVMSGRMGHARRGLELGFGLRFGLGLELGLNRRRRGRHFALDHQFMPARPRAQRDADAA